MKMRTAMIQKADEVTVERFRNALATEGHEWPKPVPGIEPLDPAIWAAREIQAFCRLAVNLISQDTGPTGSLYCMYKLFLNRSIGWGSPFSSSAMYELALGYWTMNVVPAYADTVPPEDAADG